MNKAHASTHDLVRNLQALNEHKLAMRVAIVNLQTNIIALQGERMRRKMNKHNARVEKHEARINKLADELPSIIMSHQK